MKVEVGINDSTEEIIEEGVGVIARGVFRISATSGPRAAADEASMILNHIRGQWVDLMRQAAKQELVYQAQELNLGY